MSADDRDREGTEADDGGDEGDAPRDSGPVSFSLPPISLPPMFPEEFRVVIPRPGRPRRGPLRVDARTALVTVVALDLVDAALAVAGGPPPLGWGRAVAGLLAAASLAGLPGFLYGWELVAVAAGADLATVVPSLTLLLTVRLLR